ncbi:MAG: hypothetical protein H7Z43_10060 [Clostridia bacterium]|nr:hypothetical protein [Deltaproteobacteria bacterium]
MARAGIPNWLNWSRLAKWGAPPFATPGKVADAPKQDDEKNLNAENTSHERGKEKKDGAYRYALDETKKTLKEEGSLGAWKKARRKNRHFT